MSDELTPTTDNKWWLNSQTVRGVLLTLAPTVITVLSLFGVHVKNDEFNILIDAVVAFMGVWGVLMAIEGRFKATGTLTVQKPPQE